jgi:hypothetical protein
MKTALARSLALFALAVLATSVSEKPVRADADAAAEAAADSGAPESGAGATRWQPGDGTVLDTRTKLTWQLDVSMNELAWADARDYCGSLDLGGTGWRLPSVSELQTLIDESTSDPAVDLNAFPGTASDYFWTSSLLPRFENYAWTVYFGYGLSTFFDVTQLHLVRCVR